MDTTNPMGLDGFKFVEFVALKSGILEPISEMMGFSHIANHRSKDVRLYRKNDNNFIINYERGSHADYFSKEHGNSACGMAFRLKDAQLACARALDLGYNPSTSPSDRWSSVSRRSKGSAAHHCT